MAATGGDMAGNDRDHFRVDGLGSHATITALPGSLHPRIEKWMPLLATLEVRKVETRRVGESRSARSVRLFNLSPNLRPRPTRTLSIHTDCSSGSGNHTHSPLFTSSMLPQRSIYKGIVKKQVYDGLRLKPGRFCLKGLQSRSKGREWDHNRMPMGRQWDAKMLREH